MKIDKLGMEISEQFDDFCKGCKIVELNIERSIMYGEFKPYYSSTYITCKNLPKCRQLKTYMECNDDNNRD